MPSASNPNASICPNTAVISSVPNNFLLFLLLRTSVQHSHVDVKLHHVYTAPTLFCRLPSAFGTVQQIYWNRPKNRLFVKLQVPKVKPSKLVSILNWENNTRQIKIMTSQSLNDDLKLLSEVYFFISSEVGLSEAVFHRWRWKTHSW